MLKGSTSLARSTPSNAIRLRYKLALSALLVFSSIICLVLEKVHTYINGRERYDNLVFNLGLAWIPFLAAILAYITRHNRITFYLIMPVCAAVWLAFFPNAPYLLTDFQHLARTRGDAPLWFDVILLIWFSWTGLMLGIASLWQIQEIVSEVFTPVIGWVFAIGATILSSVGVFLGRFLRWNSWDLLKDLIPIAKDMAAIVRNPLDNKSTYVFTILFTGLFLFIYVAMHLFAGIVRDKD